jgi:hypothetical protein
MTWALGRNAGGERILRDRLQLVPGAASVHQALAHAEHVVSLYGDNQGGWQQVVDVTRQAVARTP